VSSKNPVQSSNKTSGSLRLTGKILLIIDFEKEVENLRI